MIVRLQLGNKKLTGPKRLPLKKKSSQEWGQPTGWPLQTPMAASGSRPRCPSCPPAPAAGVSGQRSRSALGNRRARRPRVSGGKRAPAAGDSKHPERGSALRPRPRRALGACQAWRRRGRRCRALPPELRGQGGNTEVSSARLTDEAGDGRAGRCSGCAFGSRPPASLRAPRSWSRAPAMATLPSAERRAFALKINR